MRVNVLYFHSLRAAAGTPGEHVELPAGATMADLVDEVMTRHPRANPLRASLLLARNQEYAEPDAPLADGDEIALMPPVSGG